MTAGPLSDREWRVLDVLWEGPEEGMTLGPIHEALRPGTGWSRNTVHTYLTRMAAKGLIAVEGEAPPQLPGRGHPGGLRRRRGPHPAGACLPGLGGEAGGRLCAGARPHAGGAGGAAGPAGRDGGLSPA